MFNIIASKFHKTLVQTLKITLLTNSCHYPDTTLPKLYHKMLIKIMYV